MRRDKDNKDNEIGIYLYIGQHHSVSLTEEKK